MVTFWFSLGLLLFTASTVFAENNNETLVGKQRDKRMYVCPPDFVRVNHNCYYFSKDMQTWQQAYFECQDRFSDLAIIRNSREDKSLRVFLNKPTLVPMERWIGGMYDWEQMQWKWAASGKKIRYQGFSRMNPNDKENLRWHCIIMDPGMKYKWSSRSCVTHKQYICHKRIRAVNNRERQKLKRKYKVNKDHKLNEIPIPSDNRVDEADNNLKPNNSRREHATYDNNELNNTAFGRRNNTVLTRRGNRRLEGGGGGGRQGQGRKNRNRNNNGGRRNGQNNRRREENAPQTRSGIEGYNNARYNKKNHDPFRRRRNKSKESKESDEIISNAIRPAIYSNDVNSDLHPHVIVEEIDMSTM